MISKIDLYNYINKCAKDAIFNFTMNVNNTLINLKDKLK